MINIWERFGTDYQKYIGLNDFATNFSSKDIQLTINNKNIANLNFCCINTDNVLEQKNVAEQYFNSDMIIYSSEKSQESISVIAQEYNLKYIGTVPFLKKDSNLLDNIMPPQKNITMRLAKNQNDLEDMIKIYETSFNDKNKNFERMFSQKLLYENSINIYLAYENDNDPVSTVTTISYNNIATIWGAVTQDNYKNNGIMTNLIDYAIKNETESKEIKEYYGIVLSEQFNKMCLDKGAILIDRCHIWMNGGNK